jgi:NitT/TauT family transport system ATP-binding protein
VAFIDFKDVALEYKAGLGNAIEDITLQINDGEFVAIVGPSGCGKSTFMKLCTGLKLPTAGSVQVAGAAVSGPLKITGMAFQASNLLPWRTTLENVMLPLEIVAPYRSEFKAKKNSEFKDRAMQLISLVGLQGWENKFPWELSGGMQQRASICRALVHNPKLLMLDEPFGALDAFTREELWCVLRDLHAAVKFTVVLVTHDLRESVFLADTVYCMSKRPGRILTAKQVPFARPRELELTYKDDFNAIVHELRELIGTTRKAV